MLFIHWNVDPNIPLPFKFLSLQWYGLMWTFSILGSFFIGRKILMREKANETHLVLLIQYIFIGAIIGARLGQVLLYDLPYFIDNPAEIWKVWKGGLASHGGVVGGLVAIFIFQKKYPIYSLVWIFDRVALVLFLPTALIRLGNLFNSELYGNVTDVPWAFIFEHVDRLPRHPVVLYESICYTLLQLFILRYFFKHGQQPWLYVAYFFVGTFSVRFLLEFMKEPEGALLAGTFSKTQLFNLPFLFLGIFFLWLYHKNKQQNRAVIS